MAQITFTANQVDIARQVFEVLIWPLAWGIFKFSARKAVLQAEIKLNEIVTDNVNRNRDETLKGFNIYFDNRRNDLLQHIDNKFKDHEEHEDQMFERIGAFEKRLDTVDDIQKRLDIIDKEKLARISAIEAQLKEIADTLRNGMKP